MASIILLSKLGWEILMNSDSWSIWVPRYSYISPSSVIVKFTFMATIVSSSTPLVLELTIHSSTQMTMLIFSFLNTYWSVSISPKPGSSSPFEIISHHVNPASFIRYEFPPTVEQHPDVHLKNWLLEAYEDILWPWCQPINNLVKNLWT